MIQIESRVNIVDNSGAKFAKCIKVLNSFWRREAGLGDFIIVVIYRQRFLKKKSLRKKIVLALIIGLRKNVLRLNGHYIRWTKNSVILFKEDFYLLGTKIFSAFPREIFLKNINSKNFSKQIYRYIRGLMTKFSHKNVIEIESPHYMSTMRAYETIFEIPKFDRIVYRIPFYALSTLTKLEWLHYAVFILLAFGRTLNFTRSKFTDLRKKRRVRGNSMDFPIRFQTRIELSSILHPGGQGFRAGIRLVECEKTFYFILRFQKIPFFGELLSKFFLNHYPMPYQTVFENNLSLYEGHFPIRCREDFGQYSILFSILDLEY